jgi:hypothetical protein
MKSIKPGRGPSAMNAVSEIGAAIFGIFWTVTTVKIGAPIIFPAFGILFIVMAVIGIIYNVKNTAGKNRMSMFDITENGEETDPIEKYIKKEGQDKEIFNASADVNFCPYCGKKLDQSYSYCPKCGKDLSGV